MDDNDRAAEPRRSPLHESHASHGARFTLFSGWEMPLQYPEGTVAECKAVREACGVFDVSHLGRVWLGGEHAADALRSVTSYDIRAIGPGNAHYSLYCNERGGIEDDVFVYRLPDERWLVVQNAANHAAGLARLVAAGAAPKDATASSVMLAVQGPSALATLAKLLGDGVLSAERNACLEVAWRGTPVVFARTGYTGEDGGECIIEAPAGRDLFEALIAAGAAPAGLAARDILRLEAALPLHGHDIGPETNPFEAGLGFAVSLDDGPFTGKEALLDLKADEAERKLSCIETPGRAVLRAGYPVMHGDENAAVADLTSGAFSPRLGRGIGMAYLPAALSAPGTQLSVRVRSTDVPAIVVRRPFYRRRG